MAYLEDNELTQYPIIKSSTLTGAELLAGAEKGASIPNVDNTSDIDKPISTAQQQALDLKANQSSISNIDNTSDLNKPISTATQNALNGKASLRGTETVFGGAKFSLSDTTLTITTV